ncbi:histidine utilization repressor [Dethiosulfatarculus sandiegensis]|uniref:Histidine utilization repressor n=1 Tax=Dethiosulfatarculus sandiegensis TaxID=1429043 RepID=A0A0D2J9E9_9BACT|nr:histidine utilization repressor [Dethiosulfatarculus sandiegensis]KIX14774.1 hypothetical protein X474_06425 [Dethiosulfatarculus sandiegensis]
MHPDSKETAKKDSTPLPLYQQVKEHILSNIKAGQWPAGARVPSENELVDSLGVSRMTANRAVRELTAEGVLVRMQGKGTFVRERKPVATLLEIKPIADEIAQKGGVHSSRLHILEMVRSQGELALAMNLTPGDKVCHVVLVHMDNGNPVQLEDRYVNPLVAPEFMEQDFTKTTPSRYLLDVAPLTEVEHVVEALLPDKNTQDLLYLNGPEPCLVLYRRTWSHDKVATRSTFVHPGSRFRLGGRFKPSSQARPLEA